MTTAEKRADLQARGEPWPLCDCHGEEMFWNRNPQGRHGGYFRCRIHLAALKQRRRAQLHAAGFCINCGHPRDTKTMCRPCADKHSSVMVQPKQALDHQFAQARHRQRARAAEGFEPTGVLRRLIDGQV